MRVWVRWFAWLCLSLMLWTVAAESTHNHPNQTESATCLICVAAHGASPTVTSGHAAPVFAAIGILQEQTVLANARPDFSEAGIRGPPSIQ
jgi:hypothetical protein